MLIFIWCCVAIIWMACLNFINVADTCVPFLLYYRACCYNCCCCCRCCVFFYRSPYLLLLCFLFQAYLRFLWLHDVVPWRDKSFRFLFLCHRLASITSKHIDNRPNWMKPKRKSERIQFCTGTLYFQIIIKKKRKKNNKRIDIDNRMQWGRLISGGIQTLILCLMAYSQRGLNNLVCVVSLAVSL